MKILHYFLFTLFPLSTILGGGKRIRTADPLVANQALSPLSYTPLLPPSNIWWA